MKEPALRCKDEMRRHEVRKKQLNGLDYLEVSRDQKELHVYFLGKAPEGITADNVRIEGGQRIRNIQIDEIRIDPGKEADQDDRMTVRLFGEGDFSTYTLRLVGLQGIDRRYDHLDFSFKAGCATDLDCKTEAICPSSRLPEPDINYLAKDYASFRQLILDRLALIMPEWRERHVPDQGIALVELLAYTGDYLSYYQDAVATEAYLETARQRISVRRHVRLVDYLLHEGCNSRAWICVETDDDFSLDPQTQGAYYFLAATGNALPVPGSFLSVADLEKMPSDAYLVFEPVFVEEAKLYQAHNEIPFYTWGDRECCLIRGATSATLKDELIACVGEEQEAPIEQEALADQEPPEGKRVKAHPPPPPPPPCEPERKLHLKAGDVLIFEEVLGPKTGNPADADPSHRHAVRLVKVEPDFDALYDQPILKIEWASEDALPFPLCISSLNWDCSLKQDVSVARGNVILADHGRTVPPESLDLPPFEEEPGGCEEIGEQLPPLLRAGLFRPTLRFFPVTHAVPFPEPSDAARVQAQILAGLMDRVLQRVEALLGKVRDGKCLSQAEIDEVVRIFGRKAADEVGLAYGKPLTGEKSTTIKKPPCQKQATALEKLLAKEIVYLAGKSRRLGVLLERARSGYVMGAMGAKEIEEMFGPAFAVDLKSPDHFIPASLSLEQDPRSALPSIRITENKTGDGWTARRDLLDSGPLDRHFVAEIDNDLHARLRFGDGEMGREPEPDDVFEARYRIGNGLAGNVGAEAISYVVFSAAGMGGIKKVRNPLPARGGVDPEPLAEVKLFSPGTFRKYLQRAIVAEDYALLVERDFADRVQNAAAEMRWNGSWYEVRVAVDQRSKAEADDVLLNEVAGRLNRYRRIGHNLGVRPARHVPLDIEMEVCVLPHYHAGEVKAALLEVFSNRALPDGSLGFFHPDNLTFGEGVRLSKLVATAMSVTGIESLRVTRLERLFEGSNHEIENGILPIGPSEVARLDNDPGFPENGKLVLHMGGGL